MQDLHHGKEIYLFFGQYNTYGLIGILISSILMGIIIYKVFMITKKNNIENYGELISLFHFNKDIQNMIQIMIQIFLLISFYIMIAGFSAYFLQEWGLPIYVGTIVIVYLCYITLMGNIERLIKINTVLVPILMISILLLISKNMDVFQLLQHQEQPKSLIKAIWDAIIYTSYNSVILVPILLPLQKKLNQKSQFFGVSAFCTIILAILALSIFGLLLKIDIDINQLELPTVYVAGMMKKGYKIIYGIIILVSIYTSAVSAGYAFLEKYQHNSKQYKKIIFIMCVVAFLVSNIGFTTLINLLYPIFGILGLIQMILILKKT